MGRHIDRDSLIRRLEGCEQAYFPDDPDQFTVRAIAEVLTYLDDEDIAYHVGRVLRKSIHLITYYDDYDGVTRAGFDRALAAEDVYDDDW
jgi:hypothetical protein